MADAPFGTQQRTEVGVTIHPLEPTYRAELVLGRERRRTRKQLVIADDGNLCATGRGQGGEEGRVQGRARRRVQEEVEGRNVGWHRSSSDLCARDSA
jgi:hypothetical protein